MVVQRNLLLWLGENEAAHGRRTLAPDASQQGTSYQKETSSWYSSKLDIEKKFALVQVEWAHEGYRHDGGSGSGSVPARIIPLAPPTASSSDF